VEKHLHALVSPHVWLIRRHPRHRKVEQTACNETGFSFVDSSFFLFFFFFMHELAKAVLALALSTAAAVWLMGVALHLWPSADQLAYGNPLPYLKVKFDRPVNAVKFWVEDFGGLQYERVWLYVNGRLAASGGPGTNATAKCGDEVAAVVKYHSGVKKLEGRILCTKPIKPPGGEVKRAIRLIQTAKAYRAMTGDMDQTGPPLRFDGWCNILPNGIGEASVAITATRPDVVFCIGTTCGTSYTSKWKDIVRSIRQTVPIAVFKAPDAPASQLLGGGRGVVDIYIDYYDSGSPGYTILNVYVNGTRVASCYRETTVSTETVPWAVYKKPNATGVYLTRIYKPGGPVFDGNLAIYEFNGTYGFDVTVNPVAGETGPSECKSLSPTGIAVEVGEFCFTVDFGVFLDELHRGPLWRFFKYLYSSGGTDARSALALALNATTDLEYNVQRIVERGNSTVLVYHSYLSRQSGSAALRFKTLSISSLGAVYANAILPIDISLPPPAVELPQIIRSSQPNKSPPSSQQSLKDLLRNITRTYIVAYKG
jgi:hypothetical protein